MSFFSKPKPPQAPPPAPPPPAPPAVQKPSAPSEGDVVKKELKRRKRRTKSILTSTSGAAQEALGSKTLLGG